MRQAHRVNRQYFSGSDYSSWKSLAEKYTTLDSTASNDQSCSLVVGGLLTHYISPARSKISFSASGRIYHQANIEVVKCIDPRYRITLAQQIATKFRDPDSRVLVRRVFKLKI